MSLVEDSQAMGSSHCQGPDCGASHKTHIVDIGKDAPLRDITFQDAINFLEKVQDQW